MYDFKILPVNDDQLNKLYTNITQSVSEASMVVARYIPSQQVMSTLINYINQAALPETTTKDLPKITSKIRDQIVSCLINFPGLIIIYDDVDWTDYVNLFLKIVENYVQIQITVNEDFKDEEQQSYINDIKKALKGMGLFGAYGANVKDMIRAMQLLLKDARLTRATQPVSLQLSKSYLDAIINN